ncbi:GPI inositol-deacylase [Mucor ambiguus]|uniref:GPI inositol-deacylase n=1 Tax=Mucor ambiguus TaxID=91626 RepID=A0A0C9MF80_9FUNG|nr:GPI inositol-deacylase [Mucor ambiguus]
MLGTRRLDPQRHEQQQCAMSYAYPTFTEITNNPNSTLSAKYKLYLYREGYLDGPDQLYGVPALFIPGQAGSHKQIRSLASTTTHLYHDEKLGRNIDYFTVDLNEELSALSGQTLLDQAEYMNQAVARILSLYEHHPSRPTSVIIIGHSMGGLVARTMFMLPSYVHNSITNMITLATPHLAAPLLLDATICKTYKKLTQFWTDNKFDNLTLISIAGGSLDSIVHSDGVNTASFIPATHGFTTYTTSIPGVWTGADHMAILWCNQFIRILAKTLLETVHVASVEERMQIYKRNLLDGRDDSVISHQITDVNVDELEIKTWENASSPLLFDKQQKTMTLIKSPASVKLQLLTNIDRNDDNCWSIVQCYDVNSCKYTMPQVTVLPSAFADSLIDSTTFRLLDIDTANSSCIGIIQHCQMPADTFMQMYQDTPTVHENSVWSIIQSGVSFTVDSHRTTHVFPLIRNSLFAFDVKVASLIGHGLYKPMMKQMINNVEIKYYRHLEANQSDRTTFHQEMDKAHQGLSFQFFTDRQVMNIEIKLDWYGTLGRCVLRYGAILANFFWVSSLIILMTQANTYALNGKREFVAYPVALVQCIKGPFLQLIALLMAAVVIISCLPCDSSMLSLFVTKYMLLGSNDWLFGGLLILAFALSVGLNAIIWLLISLLTLILSTPMRFMHSSNVSPPATFTKFFVHLSIVAGLLSFLPSAVVFTLYFSVWLFMTCTARNAARSDLPLFQNTYKYRQSWLIFLVSLLPYYIPHLIIYIKNLLIGWTYQLPESPLVLAQDIPVLMTLVFLITVGRNPDVASSK